MSGGVLIVGGSVGGIRTARALRNEGYVGKVTVVEAESHLPYDKPPLSKAPLDGDAHVPLLTAEEARELDIELVLGRAAVELRPQDRQVVLGDGVVLDYEELVIATGAAARPAPWSGPGVHVLRTIADARALRESLLGASHLLVVGAGFIGAEVASLARKQGIEVTIVDPAPTPMARVMGDELGQRFSQLHRTHGVDTRFGATVDTLEHVEGGIRAELSDGASVLVDAVVVGIGAVLNTRWLESSGLALEDGVECDEFGRVAGAEHIFAVGDIARWYQPRQEKAARVEHWTNAVEQANCVARNIFAPDAPVPHDPVAYVWSDQYDWKIQLFGTRDITGTPVVVEQAEPFRLAAIWQDADGRASGGLTVNWPKASVQLRRTIAAGGSADQVHAQIAGTAVQA
ncbi:NAD(P)/FAD-dependent oxidoreductase [Rhodococcus sp. TAF43]|uniref:NAD(P)/FAD-dependent oxidoreductase n=1 Tax=unclassified Rhodococcus (in: high G+C Gram-positive bacteria) TaxID=192944 RepID=UPI0015840413|nr:FAD-dependent oxidoreductase [Rhodococcus sp. W8901]QKT13409.1 FAD-dependent oxidoreductase [Rhodococcus sp. W8901]